MPEYIIKTENIVKKFPGVTALADVSFSVKKGEIHCLVGENGAGKSTLMKILSGVHPHGSYTGKILLNNVEQKFHNTRDSEDAKIAIIYQELALVPYMSIYENIFLGREEMKVKGIIDWNKTIERSKEILKEVGLNIDPGIQVGRLGVGKQQLVEIAKALSKNVDLLILDEPTAALNKIESKNLLNILKRLQKEKGITNILISHKLDEVLEVGETITVLRDGKTVHCFEDTKASPVTEREIITHMVGRELVGNFPPRSSSVGEVIFEIKDWNVHHPNDVNISVIKNANINIRKGEIVGLAGLMGAGRTEFAMSIFGHSYGSNISGSIKFRGKHVAYSTPNEAIRGGLAYLSEDRKEKGLILIQNVKQNISLASLGVIGGPFGWKIDNNKEIAIAEKYRKEINIKTPSVEQLVKNLSGGNQQKVALSKWLMSEPELLILDEPTRGIDVGAKFEIYTIMHDIVADGRSILMISSELPELLGMCDRIYVMHEGTIAGEVSREEANQDLIMSYATGLGG